MAPNNIALKIIGNNKTFTPCIELLKAQTQSEHKSSKKQNKPWATNVFCATKLILWFIK